MEVGWHMLDVQTSVTSQGSFAKCWIGSALIAEALAMKMAIEEASANALILAGGHGANGGMGHGSQTDGESNNATIFVGGLDADITDEDLREPFSEFGEVVSVKIPVGKGCGFVQFANRKSAEDAIQSLNGTVIGKNTVRLSWGRSPNKQWRGDLGGQQWNGGYSRGQGYYNGGYANPQDSNIYPGET